MPQVDERKTGEKGDGLNTGLDSDSKVVFLPEQQAKVQELIDDAYRKAYAKAQRSKGTSEEMDRLKSEVDSLRQDKKTAAILRALSRHSVVDAEEVTELLKDKVRLDEDGGISVVGDSGASKVNSSGLPMTIEEYVAHWLKDRPHHLRALAGTGAGSQGARFGSGGGRYNLTDPGVWRTMPREELDRLLKDGISVRGSSGQNYQFRDVKNPFIEARKRKFQH